MEMNDQQLVRRLQSVGKEVFVTYFCEFADPYIDVAAILKRDRCYTDGSCKNRTSHARGIINAGRAKDALTIISNSPKVTPHVISRAKELLATNF